MEGLDLTARYCKPARHEERMKRRPGDPCHTLPSTAQSLSQPPFEFARTG